MVIIALPVKRYIRHYLETFYGNPERMYNGQILVDRLSRHQQPGITLYLMLENPIDKDKHRINASHYNDKVYVEIKEDVFMRRGHFVTNGNIVAFNTTVEREIKNHVRISADKELKIYPDAEIKKVLESALEGIGLGDEIFAVQSIIKDYYRYRLNKKDAIILRKSA